MAIDFVDLPNLPISNADVPSFFGHFFYRGPLRRQSVLSVPALRNRWSRISAPLPCTVRRDFRRSQEMVHQPLLVVQKKWVWVNTY